MNDTYVGLLHRGRGDPLRRDLDRRVAVARRLLGRPAGRRRPARPGPRLQVGRPLRDRRHRPAHPRSVGARADRSSSSASPRSPAGSGTWRSRRAREATSGGNVAFLLLMVALTLVAAAVAVLHPIAWTVEEVRIAVAGPAAAGILVALAAIPLGLGTAAIAAAVGLLGPRRDRRGGVLGGGAARLRAARRRRRRPTTRQRSSSRPPRPRTGWLRPGWLWGIPIAWAGVSLLAIPLAVYVVSYLPWARPRQPDR